MLESPPDAISWVFRTSLPWSLIYTLGEAAAWHGPGGGPVDGIPSSDTGSLGTL